MNNNLALGLLAAVLGSAGLRLYWLHLKEGRNKQLEKVEKLNLINAEITSIKFMVDYETKNSPNSLKR